MTIGRTPNDESVISETMLDMLASSDKIILTAVNGLRETWKGSNKESTEISRRN
jgi:hypothetical protein